MQNLKELTNQSFDAIHEILCDHLIETKGDVDHDEHGELLVDVIWELQKRLTQTSFDNAIHS